MWPKVSTLWPHVFNLSESAWGHGKLKTRRHGEGKPHGGCGRRFRPSGRTFLTFRNPTWGHGKLKTRRHGEGGCTVDVAEGFDPVAARF
jgi:hypothetical protein